jgi:hypothetical protein
MPNFDAESLVRWVHFIMLALAGGAMPVCLMLSGFEDTQEEIRGLSAVIWKKVARWGIRLAVLAGIALLVLQIINGGKPFSHPHLMFKLGIAPILVLLCETAPKALGAGKRGAAMLAVVIFVLVSFVASNGRAFFEAKPEPEPVAAADLGNAADLPALTPKVTTPSVTAASTAAPEPAPDATEAASKSPPGD